MFNKDRYSRVFVTITVSSLTSVYFLRSGKNNLAALSLLPVIICIAYIAYLFTRPAKLHLTKEQKERLDPEYKGENDCKFSKNYTDEVDGIRLNGQRYKFVNGTDACINESDEIVPCGFGSSLMQVIGGGGLEPESIQKDACWQ